MHENRFRSRSLGPSLLALTLTPLAMTLGGCASAPQQTLTKEDVDLMRSQLTDLRAQMSAQSNKLESLETRMGSLNEKVSLTQSSMDNLLANHKAVETPVASHPSEGAGTEPQAAQAESDPEVGFSSDTAIQDFRKGQILLDAQKYPESVLAFTSFLEKYPDHPLAGSAQYGIGEAYFKQKEYKLCLHEFERVLTSYDRSPHISDTLRDLAEAEDVLKMTEQAARHRQLLTSLFPQSPAAVLARAEPAPAEAARAETNHADPVPPTAPLTNPTEAK